MQRAFSRELVILAALVGLIAGYSAWNAGRVEAPPTPEASPVVMGTEVPDPMQVVTSTPVPTPKARPPHVAVKKKPAPKTYNPPYKPYSAPPRRPGKYEEGGDSLYTY